MEKIYRIDQINVEWVYKIFELVDTTWISMNTVTDPACNGGVDFGKRRDVFNRLTDLFLIEKNKSIKEGQFVKLTDKGVKLKQIFSCNKLKGIEYLHAFHIIESFRPNVKRYFTTYRFACEIFFENKELKQEHYSLLVNKLEEYFNASSEGITGMDKSTISKSTVFAREITKNEKRNIDLKLASYCLQQYIEAKTGSFCGQLLISDDAIKEISVLFLIDKREVTTLLDRIIKMIGTFQKKHAVAGSYITLLKQNDIC